MNAESRAAQSTTGVIVRRGKHMLRHMSCLQTLVALSSGEAEYYTLIRGACASFGNSIALPRLDDRNSDTDLQRQFTGRE